MFDMGGGCEAQALLADVPDIDTVIGATDTMVRRDPWAGRKSAGKRVPEDIQRLQASETAHCQG